MRLTPFLFAIALLALPVPAAAEGSAEPGDTDAGADRIAADGRAIEMHVGLAGRAYLGQPLADLQERFPQAEIVPFARDENILVVKIADSGISCFVVGEERDAMNVASVGFNFEGPYEGVGESGLKTAEGIGKGSTVNELLGVYGRAEIADDGPRNPLLRRRAEPEDPNRPQKYIFTSDDGRVKTYFQIRGPRVLRMVINDIEPIDRYIIKRSSR